MDPQLPDLDEPISFAVDNGAQAGPLSMRSIVDSVRSGHRGRDTLIWWAEQPEWVPFSSVPGLLALVEQQPDEAHSDPEPEPTQSALESVSEKIESLRPVDEPVVRLRPAGRDSPPDPELEALFAEMAERTVAQDRRGWTQRLDLELRRALTGVTLQQGHILVEMKSTGVSHLMTFEEPDGSRVTVGIEHLPPSSTASVSIGWGQKVADVSPAPQPAADAADIDTYVAGGYAFVVTDLIWEYDDYASDGHVDSAGLVRSVEAAVHVLRTQWHQRFVEARAGD